MGASRSERPITRRERAVASGSPPMRPRAGQDHCGGQTGGTTVCTPQCISCQPIGMVSGGLPKATPRERLEALRESRRRATRRNDRGHEQAIECSRSRATGGVSGARSEGDPEGAFRPCAARARPKRRAAVPERRPSGRRAPCGPGAPRREARHPVAVTAKSSPRSAPGHGPHLPRCRRRSR